MISAVTSSKPDLLESDVLLAREDYYQNDVNTSDVNVDDDIICINVSGMVFEALKSTFEKHPTTLLGDEDRRALYYVKKINAYFFDRNRQCFQAILNYYQSGFLIRPFQIPMYVFEMEVSFYDLGDQMMINLEQEGCKIEEDEATLPENPYQRKIWELLEFPDSSIAAKMVACFSIFMIMASVVTFCLETVIDESDLTSQHVKYNSSSFIYHAKGVFQSPTWEIVCVAYFASEYVIRLISSSNKLKFMKSSLNIVDLFAVFPYLVLTLLDEKSTPTVIVRIVRLTRIFRILKLSRYSVGLQVLGRTMKASMYDLFLLVLFFILGIILFATGLYYVEQDVANNIRHYPGIPSAFWYCFVTMTTVGYGDHVPVTPLGKIIGGACVLSGILMVSLMIPIIVMNFDTFYKKEMINRHMRQEFSSSGEV